jgi:hypothetical protein
MRFCYAGPHILKSALTTGYYLTNSKTSSKDIGG